MDECVDLELKQQAVNEGLTIIKSVDFLEKQILSTMKEVDKARDEDKSEAIKKSETLLRSLLKKLNNEDRNIVKFLDKYAKVVECERKRHM